MKSLYAIIRDSLQGTMANLGGALREYNTRSSLKTAI